MKYITIEESSFYEIIEYLIRIEEGIRNLRNEAIYDRWLNSEEVRKMLKISPKTLQNYRDHRLIPFSQIGKKIYYPLTGIEKFLNDNLILPI